VLLTEGYVNPPSGEGNVNEFVISGPNADCVREISIKVLLGLVYKVLLALAVVGTTKYSEFKLFEQYISQL